MRVWDNEPEEPLEVNILPMIDVIFAILAFFILSTLFLTRTAGLSENLPDAESAEPQQQAAFNVTVNPDGQITLNQQVVVLDQLQDRVENAMSAAETETALVTINADEQVYHGDVIAVMDELRLIEGVQLGIATEPEEAAPGADSPEAR